MLIKLRWLLVALLGVTAASLFVLCAPAIFTHHDLSHPESIVPWAAHLVANGQALYSDWRQWPHRFMPYGPLLCYPAGLFFRMAGLQEFGFHYYLFGRIQSLVYLVGVAGMIAAMLPGRRFGLAMLYSLAGLAMWPGLMLPGMSFRGDIPALFWALAAANVAFRFPSTRRGMFVALFLFLLSLGYRPALWSFPAAFFLFCVLRGRWLEGVMWSAAVVVCVAAYMILGNVVTRGAFLQNQIGASSIGLTADIYRMAFGLLTSRQEFPLLTWDLVGRLAVALPAAAVLMVKSKSDFDRGIAVYYIVALVVNCVTLFKVGAGLNYIIEAYVLSLAVLGIAGLRLWENRELLGAGTRYVAAGAGGLLLVLPMVYFSWFNFRAAPGIVKGIPVPAAYENLAKLPDTALLGDLAFTHKAATAHALSDPVPFAKLSAKGEIPKEPLVSRLNSRAFSHVVLSPGTKYLFFSAENAPWAGAALEANYVREKEVPEYEIWVPAGAEEIEAKSAGSGTAVSE